MAKLNDKHTGDISVTAVADYWIKRAHSRGFAVSEHMFDGSVNPDNQSCVVMFKYPTHGFRVADWWVMCEQIDTHATAPALVLKVGLLNSSTNPTGLFKEWEQSVGYLGRGKRNSVDGMSGTLVNANTLSRNADGLSALGYAYPGFDIGIHFSTVAATVGHAYKKIIMGVQFAAW